MHPHWHDFLTTRGARFADHDGEPSVSGFEYSGRSDGGETAPYELTDLSPLGLLRITGPDAARFFQGYATANVDKATSEKQFRVPLHPRRSDHRHVRDVGIERRPDDCIVRSCSQYTICSRAIVFSKAELECPATPSWASE